MLRYLLLAALLFAARPTHAQGEEELAEAPQQPTADVSMYNVAVPCTQEGSSPSWIIWSRERNPDTRSIGITQAGCTVVLKTKDSDKKVLKESELGEFYRAVYCINLANAASVTATCTDPNCAKGVNLFVTVNHPDCGQDTGKKSDDELSPAEPASESENE